MILPVETQLLYFLSTVIAGTVVGILFDVYRIMLVYNNPNRILLSISDVLFWLLCALLVFEFFLYTNNGSLRYYTFIGIAVGLILYFKLASKKFIIALQTLVIGFVRLMRFIWMVLIYPSRYVVYFIKFICMKLRALVRGGI